MSCVQSYKKFKHACQAWNQYEVDETHSLDNQHCMFDDEKYKKELKDLYSVNEFITDLNIPIKYKNSLYKSVTIDKKYKINDIIKFTIPTSWFETIEIVHNMSDNFDNIIYLQLDTKNDVNDVFNKFNDYEHEYILTPMNLTVEAVDDNLLHVSVNKYKINLL